MYEVEFRTKVSRKKYDELFRYLEAHAEKLGKDNKDCYYYIFEDKLLKVVNNTSKKTAKISLKLNRIGRGAVFPEIEIFFDPEDFKKTCTLFNRLNLPAKIMYGPQRRVNYKYRNCEIALKYSNAWKYHMEIEQVIKNKKEKASAEKAIQSVADELGVKLMSEEELKAFTEKAEKKAKKA